MRIPDSEVKRFKRDGLPPIPRPLPTESALPARYVPARFQEHSDSPAMPSEVQLAADSVAISRSGLEKRKVDRELEETEDWFRERARQKAAEEAFERQQREAQLAQEQRQRWEQQWTEYAFNSLPHDAQGEVEIEVHAAVDAVLSRLHPSQPAAIVKPLVDTAVHRGLRPWTRKQEIERALKAAMNKLPWDVRNNREYAPMKQRAWDASIEALRRLREEASYSEMETATVQALQPVIRDYEHLQNCQRIVRQVQILGAMREEEDGAKEAVRKALVALPIGAATKELEKTRDLTGGALQSGRVRAQGNGPAGIGETDSATCSGMESRSPPRPHCALPHTGIRTQLLGSEPRGRTAAAADSQSPNRGVAQQFEHDHRPNLAQHRSSGRGRHLGAAAARRR